MPPSEEHHYGSDARRRNLFRTGNAGAAELPQTTMPSSQDSPLVDSLLTLSDQGCRRDPTPGAVKSAKSGYQALRGQVARNPDGGQAQRRRHQRPWQEVRDEMGGLEQSSRQECPGQRAASKLDDPPKGRQRQAPSRAAATTNRYRLGERQDRSLPYDQQANYEAAGTREAHCSSGPCSGSAGAK